MDYCLNKVTAMGKWIENHSFLFQTSMGLETQHSDLEIQRVRNQRFMGHQLFSAYPHDFLSNNNNSAAYVLMPVSK